MNNNTITKTQTLEINRIIEVEQPTQFGYIPSYNAFQVPNRIAKDDWRPALVVEEFLSAGLDKSYIHSRNSKRHMLYAATKDSVAQFGRALFLLDYYTPQGRDGRWHILMHKLTQRKVRVCVVRVGEHVISQVEESIFDDELGKWLAWTAHPMSFKRGLYVEEVGNNEWYLMGSTYPIRELLKSVGGRWNPTKQGWKFDKGLPEIVAAMLSNRLTKYHFLVNLLDGKKVGILANGKDDNMQKDEAFYRLVDAFRREAWYVAGYDWKKFPQPNNTPEMVAEAEVKEKADMEQLHQTAQALVKQSREWRMEVIADMDATESYYDLPDHIINAMEAGVIDYVGQAPDNHQDMNASIERAEVAYEAYINSMPDPNSPEYSVAELEAMASEAAAMEANREFCTYEPEGVTEHANLTNNPNTVVVGESGGFNFLPTALDSLLK